MRVCSNFHILSFVFPKIFDFFLLVYQNLLSLLYNVTVTVCVYVCVCVFVCVCLYLSEPLFRIHFSVSSNNSIIINNTLMYIYLLIIIISVMYLTVSLCTCIVYWFVCVCALSVCVCVICHSHVYLASLASICQ